MRLSDLHLQLLNVMRRYRWSARILHVHVVVGERFQVGGLGLFTNGLQSLERIQYMLARMDQYPVTVEALD
jgi:hypothetical protein